MRSNDFDLDFPIFRHSIIYFCQLGQVHGGLENVWISIVGILLVSEDVTEEYDFELVEMEMLGDFQYDGVRVSLNERYLM